MVSRWLCKCQQSQLKSFSVLVESGCFGGEDERGCRLRDDCVATAPQQAHSAGNPMSQREKAGFSWDAPDFPVSAVDEGCVTPGASNSKLICLPEAARLSAISVLLILILQSPAAGDLQPVIVWDWMLRGIPAPLPFPCLVLFFSCRASQVSRPSPKFIALASGVAQLASVTASVNVSPL
jgi:hypothetical protein